MKTTTALIICVLCLCGFSIAFGYSLGQHSAAKTVHDYELARDTAGLFSDIIRLHQDCDCPYIEEDIENVLNSDSITSANILGNYSYCY